MITKRGSSMRTLDSGIVTMLLSVLLGIASYFFGQPMAIELHWLWIALGSVSIVALAVMQYLRTRATQRRDDELSAIVDAVPHMLFFKGKDSSYRLLNAEFERIFGADVYQMIGTDGSQVWAGRTGRIRQEERELMAGGEARTYDEVLAIDGERRELQLRKQPVRDRRGELIGIVGIAIDVTEHKRLVRELEGSQADLELALATGGLGVWRSATDFEGDAGPTEEQILRTPLQMDSQIQQHFGLGTASDMSYADLLGLLHPDDREAGAVRLREVFAEERGSFRGQRRMQDADGRSRVLDVRASLKTVSAPDDGGGRRRLLIGIAKDITREELYKDYLSRKAEEAQAALDAKVQFLAMMSHEVRTPLSGVLGMLELVLDTGLSAEQRAMLLRSRESCLALLTIINDILDFSKIEAGKLDIERRPLALAELVEQVCDLLAPEAERKSIGLSFAIDPLLPRLIAGDSVRLRQILTNLVGNAVKFTHRGRVKVDAWRSEGRLMLAVTDTGIGIDAKTIQSLFEPFRQADLATTRRYGGTGLGLTIVRQLTELMDGSVSCESEPGLGSRFIVSLPLLVAADAPAAGAPLPAPVADAPQGSAAYAPPAEAYAPPIAAEPEPASYPPATDTGSIPTGQLLILHAEDHPVNREVVLMQLAKLGYAAQGAEDGEEAWRLLMEPGARYALLLTDCHMPKVDGYELTRRLRAREAELGLLRLPIVGLTANIAPAEAERCVALGMDACLTKPLPIAQLQRAIAEALRARRMPASGPAGPADAGSAEPSYPSLTELCGGRLAKVAEMLQIFVRTTVEDLQAMDSALADGDRRRLRELAHRLSSASQQLDEARSVRTLRALEAKDEDGAMSAEPVHEELHRQARAELEAVLGRARAFIERHGAGTRPQ